MSDIKNAVVSKAAFVQAHERAVREMRAEYEMSKQTRIEAGVTIRTYVEWLEDQLQISKSLTEYYRKELGERQMFLITFQHYGQINNLAIATNLTAAKWFVSKEAEREIKEDEWQEDQDN